MASKHLQSVQPIDSVEWVARASVRPNDYNPNSVPPPEFRLLKISILTDGWTQPIVVCRGSRLIIDGEHRWIVASDPEIARQTNGKIPVVYLTGDLTDRMMATIRHNRARGEHGVLPMAAIVRALLETGSTKDDVMFLLQMEEEEVNRLAERAGLPEVSSRQHGAFNQGWVPS